MFQALLHRALCTTTKRYRLSSIMVALSDTCMYTTMNLAHIIVERICRRQKSPPESKLFAGRHLEDAPFTLWTLCVRRREVWAAIENVDDRQEQGHQFAT